MSLTNKSSEKQLEENKVEENKKEEEQKQQLLVLNNLLFSTIAEYTRIRNEHAKMLEQQLCPIRCDIEMRIRSADLGFFKFNVYDFLNFFISKLFFLNNLIQTILTSIKRGLSVLNY